MRWRPLLEEARRYVPPRMAEAVQPKFLIGFSPKFIGLHSHEPTELGPEYAETVGAWTYDDMAHACCPPFFDPVIVMPKPALYRDQAVGTLLHEWGHLFDAVTGYSLEAPVTTPYSKTNRRERIAEAIETVLVPPSGAWEDYVAAEAFRPLREALFA